LLDIIVIAICAAICGAETWVDIANFGKARIAMMVVGRVLMSINVH
jgi:hypothetical protein